MGQREGHPVEAWWALRVVLLNMPFAEVGYPSLGLMQLRQVTDRQFGDEVSTEIHQLNQHFAEWFGLEMYQELAANVQHITTGLGDWLFRHVAFPNAEDNADQYLSRYYRSPASRELREHALEKRSGIRSKLNELIDRLDLASADVVGCTSMFSTHGSVLALTRMIKERNPSVVTAVGGANCEGRMGRVLADEIDWIDFVFSGPALQSFPQLLESLQEGDEARCHRIDGVFTAENETGDPLDRQHSGLQRKTDDAEVDTPKVAPLGAELPIGETPRDLDYASFLDELTTRFPESEVKPVVLFETSRGCWWGEKAHCTFCGLNGSDMNYRSLDPDDAKDLFESLFELSSEASRIKLTCSDNIIPRSYFEEVLPELDPPENMSLFYEVKADLSKDQVQTMAEAGIDHFQPGIEALSTDVLGLMRKGTNAFVNLELLKNCRRFDLTPHWNLLVGFPGESEEVYEKYSEDLPLLTHLPPPLGSYPVRFDRYSPYFEEQDEYGLDLGPLDFYEYVYPFDREQLADLAYYFDDENHEADYKLYRARHLRSLQSKVERWKDLWDNEQSPPQLALEDRGGDTWIKDTRPGWEDEYRLPPDQADVLRAASTMTKPRLLADDLPRYTEQQHQRIIKALEDRGLVFREADRVIGLALPASAYASDAHHESMESIEERVSLTA